jgi:putative ABC transport system permease protein
MLYNYLKMAVPNQMCNKGYTAINTMGLAIGICCCFLIMLFMRSEFSFDAFHADADRLPRQMQHEKYDGEDFLNTLTPLSMGAVMQQSLPNWERQYRVFATTLKTE